MVKATTNLRIVLTTAPAGRPLWRAALNSIGAKFTIVDQLDTAGGTNFSAMLPQPNLALIDVDYLGAYMETNLSILRQSYPALPLVGVARRHRRGLLDSLYRSGVRGYVTSDIGVTALGETLATIIASPRAFVVRIGG